ncbi:hypothetical protein AB0B50_00090 [Streptomyces sp. NPDC041068]|uniref:hypothetical protein n=1 Tax=Streptomyces sp. NPDC041068 TaxID=3155130 RepID=UPI0034104B58
MRWIKVAGALQIGGAALGRDAESDARALLWMSKRLDESPRLTSDQGDVLMALYDAYARA